MPEKIMYECGECLKHDTIGGRFQWKNGEIICVACEQEAEDKEKIRKQKAKKKRRFRRPSPRSRRGVRPINFEGR